MWRLFAQKSFDFRTLGLGYANLGALLMVSGLPYNSEEARATAGAITALLTGAAYSMSSELAEKLGAFEEFDKNHIAHSEKGNKAAGGRARKHIGELKKLVTEYRRASVLESK